MLLKVEGLRSAKRAINLLGTGEHLWVRGIGDVLIYVCRLGEAVYRVSVCSAARIATRFCVKGLRVDARMSQVEAYRLVEKLGARPCKVVNSKLVDEPATLSEANGGELSYQDFVNTVKGMGLRVQINP
jgi:hypothetical protein